VSRIPCKKVKVIPQQAEVAQGVPGRLKPRIFLTFGITRVVGRQPNATAAFTLGEILGAHFQRLRRPQGTWFHRGGTTEKIPSNTTGKIFGPTRSDDGYWRIKSNQEINDVLKGQNIIGFIKRKD